MRYLITPILLLTANLLFAQKALKPFPQHVAYTAGSIKPNHISQQQMDKNVVDFYLQWKHRYVRSACTPGQSYVWFEAKGRKQCVSEGQGYGMMITALMAGADPSAHLTFDGLYRYYQAHISKRSKHLMAWAQDKGCKSLDGTSATDGDMDIAYALLLADKQWGSKGGINYLSEAKAMLADIMKLEINPKTYTILLSDGLEAESRDYFDTRASDFMPDHFKAFRTVTNDKRWDKVSNNTYALFAKLQTKYSPKAGLIPDFIQHTQKNATPARPHYLEGAYDGDYYYNACRVPWRLATDYLTTGDERPKRMLTQINRWIRHATKDDPDAIHAGYLLNGKRVKGDHFPALSFIAPLMVSAMVEKSNQQWLNKLWDYLVAFKLRDFDYYDNSIKLMGMIVGSGNWWGD